MRPWEKAAFNALTLVVAASGLAYVWMKYGLTSDDPFALVNHPWQPWMLAVHVFTAPWLLVVFGIVLNSHVLRKIGNGTTGNRPSGWLSLVTFAGMTVSGYGLQVATAALLRQTMLVLHLASSAVFLVAYSVHLLVAWRTAAVPQGVGPVDSAVQAGTSLSCPVLDSPPDPPSSSR